MISQKGAKEDTNKKHKYSQTDPEKKVFNLEIVFYLNALRAYTATVPMTQYDVPEVSRRFRPHLPLHFAIQISEK